MTPLQEALAPRSDQLNSDDLIIGPRTITITDARIVEGDRGEKKIVVRFDGDNGKPWKCCKTTGRAMIMIWGITDEAQLIGKSVTLYRDPEVSFGKERNIGGIRISHMSHIERDTTVKLTVSQGKKMDFVFKPLAAVKANAPDASKAQAWTKTQIAAIEAAITLDELTALNVKAFKPLGKLAVEHPDLWTKIDDAYRTAQVDLEPSGRADADMGERDDPPAEF